MKTNREKQIRDIMKFAKGGKIKKHYLRFLNDTDEELTDMPDNGKEIDCPFDLVVQFVDFSDKRNLSI